MSLTASPPGCLLSLLLVDDEPGIVGPMARFFRHRGFRTDVACEPELAEALVEFWHYDVAVVDLRLTPWGDASGLDLLRHIRERGPWTLIIVLSGHVTEETEAEARRRGADAILQKPQPLDRIADLVTSLVAGRDAAAADPVGQA